MTAEEACKMCKQLAPTSMLRNMVKHGFTSS